MKHVKLVLCALLLVVVTGCAPLVIGGVAMGGAAGAAVVVKWLASQSWMPTICYWAGDEAALAAMPAASRNLDADVVAFCDEAIAYLDNANGMSADVVNATLVAQIAKLPPAQIAWIQGAAVILDDFVPPAVSTAVLTSSQINCIEGLVKGIRDGTQTCMDKLPVEVQKALLKAQSKKLDVRLKHPAQLKVGIAAGGWFKPAPAK